MGCCNTRLRVQDLCFGTNGTGKDKPANHTTACGSSAGSSDSAHASTSANINGKQGSAANCRDADGGNGGSSDLGKRSRDDMESPSALEAVVEPVIVEAPKGSVSDLLRLA
jgi:hypothetical protein